MAGPNPAFESLSSADLLAATRDLVRQSEQMYGRAFMEQARARRTEHPGPP